MTEPTCLRCQTKMETGLIVDDFHSGMHKEQEWAAGPPKRSWWTGLNLSGKERHNVTTFRCPRCGYLESYAPQE